jgi:hypothetical protein
VNKDKPGWPEQVLSGELKPAEYAAPTVIGREAKDTGLGSGAGIAMKPGNAGRAKATHSKSIVTRTNINYTQG